MLVCGHLELSDSSFPGREKPEISALALEILQVCICVLQASFFFVLVRFFGFVFAPAFGVGSRIFALSLQRNTKIKTPP